MSRAHNTENGNGSSYDDKAFPEVEARISRDPNAAVGHEHLAVSQQGFYGHIVSRFTPDGRESTDATVQGNPGVLGLAA